MVQVGQKVQGWTVLASAYKNFDSRQAVVFLGESDEQYAIWHMYQTTTEPLNTHFWHKRETPDMLDVLRAYAEILTD